MSGLFGELLGGVMNGALSGAAPAAGTGGNAAVLSAVTGLINQHGGIGGLVQQFEQAGLGSVVKSWIGTDTNQPITAEQIGQALGPSGSLAPFAQALGLDSTQASGVLAQLLPQVIDHLTPQGSVTGEHAGLLGEMAQSLLGGKLFG